MINGANARLIVVMLAITAMVSLIGIIVLSAFGREIPEIISLTLSACMGALIGAIGVKADIHSPQDIIAPLHKDGE